LNGNDLIKSILVEKVKTHLNLLENYPAQEIMHLKKPWKRRKF